MKYSDFKWTEDDVITQSRFIELANAHSNTHVYIKSDYIYNNYKNEIPTPETDSSVLATIWDPMNRTPQFPPVQRIWITGNSDYPITDINTSMYSRYFDRWYGINMESMYTRCRAIPIGIPTTNTIDTLYSISQEPRIICPRLAYMNFNVSTYTSERRVIQLSFQDTPWITCDVNKNINMTDFYRNIRNHKFTVCPRGNGVDTHRLWEALYLGSIPIVREHPEMESFFNSLPIVKVKNWNILTHEYLDYEYERIMACDTWELDMLRMSYWENEIVHHNSFPISE